MVENRRSQKNFEFEDENVFSVEKEVIANVNSKPQLIQKS